MIKEDDSPSAGHPGPHEDRELELMLAGEKPLAWFYDTIPECGVIPESVFQPHVDSGRLVKVERVLNPAKETKDSSVPAVRMVLYALPDEAWRIDEVISIVEDVFLGRRAPRPEDDVKLGRLLGYPESEIGLRDDNLMSREPSPNKPGGSRSGYVSNPPAGNAAPPAGRHRIPYRPKTLP